jgi:hypothetical protein
MSKAQLLQPDAAAAFTRLVLGLCLGRGGITYYSRSWNLLVQQPRYKEDYICYQWSRVVQFLPRVKRPRWVRSYAPQSRPDAGNWRLRCTSQNLETAFNLLYPRGEYQLSSSVLELLGGEAIGMLWADRGAIRMHRRRPGCTGRLTLARHDLESAGLVHDWIYTLTGAAGRIHSNAQTRDVPTIIYDDLALEQLMLSLERTWMARAECLARQFRTPNLMHRGRLQRLMECERKRWEVPPRPAMRIPARELIPPSRPALRLTEEPPAVHCPEPNFSW